MPESWSLPPGEILRRAKAANSRALNKTLDTVMDRADERVPELDGELRLSAERSYAEPGTTVAEGAFTADHAGAQHEGKWTQNGVTYEAKKYTRPGSGKWYLSNPVKEAATSEMRDNLAEELRREF